jgi:Uma2 family endonuclease
MSVGVLFEDQLEIPPHVDGFDSFRRWARSDSFPERGRIDYIDGRIEVDMAADNILRHSSPKTEIGGVLHHCVKQLRNGLLFIDKTRVSCLEVDLSVEPDVVFVLHESLRTGRVRMVPTASLEPDDFIELEGPPDLIVEVVSATSVFKDTKRLFRAYFDAGVTEYWLADARGERLSFAIYRRGRNGFVKVPTDREGFQRSRVLGRHYRFERERGPNDVWIYDLIEAG